MDDQDKKPVDPSRRSFLKGMGTSVIAATAATAVSATAATLGEAVSPAGGAAGVREAVIELTVNGAVRRTKVASHWTLLEVLRRDLGFTGTKRGCDRGTCGACTVLMDGLPVYACSLLALEAAGKKIETVEGLAEQEHLHPIQQAFSKHGAYQCGFCTSGHMMSSKALLSAHPHPSADEVRHALAGNLCRCGSYSKIVDAVLDAAGTKG